MRIILTDTTGNSVERAVANKLRDILGKLHKTGKVMQEGLLHTVRNHFRTIYPGSKHYAPENVEGTEKYNGTTPYGTVRIDVPGITRAYRDLTIKPRFRKALTIPMHRSSYGKRAGEFNDLFLLKKKNGKAFLAHTVGGKLVFMYYLAKSVFQKRDERLMPSDQTLADNLTSRIFAYLDSAK